MCLLLNLFIPLSNIFKNRLHANLTCCLCCQLPPPPLWFSICSTRNAVFANTRLSITAHPALGVTGRWSLCQQSRGESGVLPWMSRQFSTGPRGETNNHPHWHLWAIRAASQPSVHVFALWEELSHSRNTQRAASRVQQGGHPESRRCTLHHSLLPT